MKSMLRCMVLFAWILTFSRLAVAQGEQVIFLVTGDIPDAVGDMAIWQQQIIDHNKYSPSEFMTHVGDIKGGTSSCPESNYRDFATMTKLLKMPFFIVPGDNDYNDCSTPSQALNYWMQYFLGYENTSCCLSWDVERQAIRPENFAFVRKGILFIGINVVGQATQSAAAWAAQLQQDADWVNLQLQNSNAEVRGAVVFAHKGPLSELTSFYLQFEAAAVSFGKPVLLMHGHGHSWINNKPFDAQNITRVQVNNGGDEAPVQVTAGMNSADMWSFRRNPFLNPPPVYNAPPCVQAGSDQNLNFPSAANLRGRTSDDGDPAPANLSVTWSKVSGPGIVSFENAHDDTTAATFSSGGIYVLRLTANDGALQAFDDVTITVTVPGPSLAINDVSINEGNSGIANAVFTVTLSNATGSNVTVNYSTADGSAVQGNDYNSIAGTLFFSGATTVQTVAVPVKGDLLDEPDETFYVTLSGPSGAGLFDPQGTCSIIDDDVPPPPVITSFTPTSGAAGLEVTIIGANLSSITGVQFNGVAASTYSLDSEMQLRAIVPAGATSGKIVVTTSAGTATSMNDFIVTIIGTLTLNPTDDAYVSSSAPTSNYGTSSTLRVRTTLYTFLKFNVEGIVGSVVNARLRLNVSDASPDGGGVYLVSNDYADGSGSWVQSGLNWNNAPTITGAPLSSVGAVSGNTRIEFPVTAAITGNGVYSFAIKSNSSDAAYYSSRESSSDPELIIDMGPGTPPPNIVSFSPVSGVIGTDVTISGTHFTGVTSVEFAGISALSFTVDATTQIRATVPPNATTGPIRITTDAGTSSSLSDFTVLPPAPFISSFTPTSGSSGTIVTITGTSFIGIRDVKFNSVNAASFTVDSATQLRATVPDLATTGKISLTALGGTATTVSDFTVILPSPPTIVSFIPASGIVGSEVTITGTNFQGVTSVRINTTPVTAYVVDNLTQIRATIPDGALAGKISVVTTGGTATSADDFTVTLPPAPIVSSFTPTSGVEGSSITITGMNFNGATVVKFDTTNASTFTVNSATQITAPVPTGATSGKISVTHAGGTGISVDDFTVIPLPPTISSFTPTSGPVTTVVTIAGTNFTGASAVQFNGLAAMTFNVVSGTQISAEVPAGATTGKIRVTTPGGTVESATNYTVTTGAALVTVFPSEDAYVKSSAPTINYATASNLRVRQSSSETLYSFLKFNVSGVAGTVQSARLRLYVSDAGPDGGTVHAVSNYYLGTSTHWVQSGLLWGNAPAISGSPLCSTGAVTIATWVECDVTTAVTGNGMFSFAIKSSASDAVYYHSKEGANDPQLVIDVATGPPPPTISSFTPASGLVGVEVTITGSAFSGVSSVTFNNIAATSYTVDSSTQIRALVPIGATTGKISVTATTGTGRSLTDFTVLQPPPTIGSFTPTSGLAGSEVTVSGTNFINVSIVKFNNLNAGLFTVDSHTQVRATVPNGASNGKISVTTPGGTATSAGDFTVLLPPSPAITSFTPTSGIVGSQVTISGSNFTGASGVTFNTTAATSFTVNSATEIVATVPTGAATGKIGVTTAGGTTTSIDDFAVNVPPLPSIASFTPTSGPVSATVTITGGNFTGATSVKFNNLNASTFVVDNDTQIRATVPANATTGRIEITTGAGSSTSVADFTVTLAAGTTVTFNPTDDAYVRAGSFASTNFGTASTLRARLSGTTEILHSYLKFNVVGLDGGVQSAKLRLKVVDASADGGSLYLVSNNYEGTVTPWDQAGLLWTNAPAMSGSPILSIGPVFNSSIIELDVTFAVTGNGIYSFGILTSSSDAVHYQSREGATKPELVVQVSTNMGRSVGATAFVAQDEHQDGLPLPKQLVLSKAYPNPFNGQATIEYALPTEGRVRLRVFNSLGQLICTVLDENKSAGYQRASWNGKDDRGFPVSSGLYLYSLEFGDQRLTGRVTLQQ